MNKDIIGLFIIYSYISFIASEDIYQFLGLVAIAATVVGIFLIEKKRKAESLEVSAIPKEHDPDVDQRLDKPTYMRQQKMMKLSPVPKDYDSDIDKMLSEPTYRRRSELSYQLFKSKPMRLKHDDEQISASNNSGFHKE
jgi:hypothetical protein